jgi:plastocyanin
MRSRGSLVALTATGVLLGAPPAVADEQIVATTPNRYTNPDVTIDQGEPLTFRNADIARHDVTATDAGDVRNHLFASDTVGNGETSFVEGSQYLTTGTYRYYCTVHAEQMKGTITVTASGTPKPRPGAGGGGGGGGGDGGPAPSPDVTAPELTLSAGSAKASSLRRGRGLRVRLGANEAARLTLTVMLGSTRAARRHVDLGSAGTRKLAFALSPKARRKLRKGGRLQLTVRGTDGAGNTATASITAKLR